MNICHFSIKDLTVEMGKPIKFQVKATKMLQIVVSLEILVQSIICSTMDTSTFQWISQEVSSNINSILPVIISITRTQQILTKQRRGDSTCLIRKGQYVPSKLNSTSFTKNRLKKVSRQNLPISHRCKLTVNQVICFQVNLTIKCWRYHRCQTR